MVKNFKTKIQAKGVYTFDYKTYDEFERKIRIDLMHKIYDFVDISKFNPSIKELKTNTHKNK